MNLQCDETGPPCRACLALDIPCTFERPSRRRGPPNRHAETFKKRRVGSPAVQGQQPVLDSPTHAAHALASFAQQQVLSAESICPFPLLIALIDDYFVYIHPLIPVPHEPSFREALHRREDLTSPTFLALLASMVGSLVASFPRKPRLHLKAQHKENLFPNSMSLVERCHKIAIEARGPGYLDREMTVYDAIISYLLGLTAAYTFNWRLSRLYLAECLTIIKNFGLHKIPEHNKNPDSDIRQPTDTYQSTNTDLISQEMGRRTFWLMFVGVKSILQLGGTQGVLFILPPSAAEPYPALPTEVDDAYIFPDHILPQPPELISELVGFNANVRVYCSYDRLSIMEMAYGIDQIYDWEQQRCILQDCLNKAKSALVEVPQELMLLPGSKSSYLGSHLDTNRREFQSPVPDRRFPELAPYPVLEPNESAVDRRSIQYEIQKANIYISQLSTRSHIVDKYWNLFDAHKRTKFGDKYTTASAAPLTSDLGHSLEEAYGLEDMLHEEMAMERERIVQDLLRILGTISQVNIEPNGASLVSPSLQLS